MTLPGIVLDCRAGLSELYSKVAAMAAGAARTRRSKPSTPSVRRGAAHPEQAKEEALNGARRGTERLGRRLRSDSSALSWSRYTPFRAATQAKKIVRLLHLQSILFYLPIAAVFSTPDGNSRKRRDGPSVLLTVPLGKEVQSATIELGCLLPTIRFLSFSSLNGLRK